MKSAAENIMAEEGRHRSVVRNGNGWPCLATAGHAWQRLATVRRSSPDWLQLLAHSKRQRGASSIVVKSCLLSTNFSCISVANISVESSAMSGTECHTDLSNSIGKLSIYNHRILRTQRNKASKRTNQTSAHISLYLLQKTCKPS